MCIHKSTKNRKGKEPVEDEVKVSDEAGNALGVNETGEILVRTARVMKGYAGNVEGGA